MLATILTLTSLGFGLLLFAIGCSDIVREVTLNGAVLTDPCMRALLFIGVGILLVNQVKSS